MKNLEKINVLSSLQLTNVQGGSGTISILDTDMESIVRAQGNDRVVRKKPGVTTYGD